MMTVGELKYKLRNVEDALPIEVSAEGSDGEFLEGLVVDDAQVYDNEHDRVFLIEAST